PAADYCRGGLSASVRQTAASARIGRPVASGCRGNCCLLRAQVHPYLPGQSAPDLMLGISHSRPGDASLAEACCVPGSSSPRRSGTVQLSVDWTQSGWPTAPNTVD